MDDCQSAKFFLDENDRPGGCLPSLKLTCSHLKMDGWKTSLSFWVSAYFQVLLLLVSGSVFMILDGNYQRF